MECTVSLQAVHRFVRLFAARRNYSLWSVAYLGPWKRTECGTSLAFSTRVVSIITPKREERNWFRGSFVKECLIWLPFEDHFPTETDDFMHVLPRGSGTVYYATCYVEDPDIFTPMFILRLSVMSLFAKVTFVTLYKCINNRSQHHNVTETIS